MAYPSKSSEIEEIEEVEVTPSVLPSDESDGSSDESETGGSESEDIDDTASKKSRDDGGKDDDCDKHDPSPNASATAASSTDVSINFTGFKPFDKEDKKKLKQDIKNHTNEDLHKMSEDAINTIKEAYEQYQFLKAIRAEEKHRRNEKNKKDKEDEPKEEYVPKMLTLNIHFSASILTIQLSEDLRGKQIRQELRRQYPHIFKSDKMISKFRITYNGEDLSFHPRRCLGSGKGGKSGWGMTDGTSLQMTPTGQGGVKGVKKAHVIKLKNINPTNSSDDVVFSEAFKASVEACSFKEVNVDAMLASLDNDTLETLRYYLAHNKSTAEVKLQKIGDYTHEAVKMNKAISKMEFSINHLKEVIFNAIFMKYSNKDGNIKMSDFQRDVDVQIGIRKAQSKTKDDTQMKD
eukprot:symbB.v1.2.039827.t1/scaffold6811.1/size15374/1